MTNFKRYQSLNVIFIFVFLLLCIAFIVIFLQQALVSVCQRGCDLFDVAFVSASNAPHRNEILLADPNRLNVITIPLKIAKIQSNSNTIKMKEASQKSEKNNEITAAKDSSAIKSPSTKKHVKLIAKKIAANVHPKSEKHDTSTSKTTVEPTSQPVQDHPVEASKQTTTTNGPRREGAKAEKNEEKMIEVKQTNGEIHVAKHIPKPLYKTETKNHPLEAKKDEHPKKKEEVLKGRLEQAKHSCRQGNVFLLCKIIRLL